MRFFVHKKGIFPKYVEENPYNEWFCWEKVVFLHRKDVFIYVQ